MTKKQLPGIIVRTACFLTLISCSDSTQFTEKTLPADLDATQENELENPNPTDPNGVYVEPGTGDEPTGNTGTGDEPTDDSGNGDQPTNDSGNGDDPNQSGDPTDGSSGTTPPVGVNPAPTPTPAPAPTPDPNAPIFASCNDQPNSPIVAQVYQLPVNTDRLPNFDAMNSVDDVCIGQLNIADRDFDQGFPGVQDLIEWFGLDIRFRVTVPVSGNYAFTINSDDGSKLYINDTLVINNDGQHAQQEKSATVNLSAGVYDFHVKYFQGPRYKIALELFWKMPGQQDRSYIPTQLLSRPE